MRVFFLVGNTSVKVAPQGRRPQSFPTDAAGGIGRFLEGLAGALPVAASVNPAGEETVDEACRSAGLSAPLYAGRDFPTGVEIDVERPEKAGIDRILNVKAAFHRALCPSAAVDLGTAVSISVADGRGHFAGGAILAGISLALKALHEGTAFLPDVLPGVPASPLGRDTVSAMQSGALYGTLGAVREVLARISADLECELEVFLTGGDCRLVGEVSPAPWHIAETLTLEGLQLAHDESLR
ncbi:MAG: type III pantothenate kinase [Planctomycetes bacterium]|nr:type III pantothenate kinase [Planctomycetota bacterium]